MNNLQTILEQFQKDYEEAYDGILSKEVLEKGNPWFEERLKQAYLAGAEEHARLSELQEKEELTSWDDPIGKEIEYTNGFNNAVYTQKELSQKALQQIKELI